MKSIHHRVFRSEAAVGLLVCFWPLGACGDGGPRGSVGDNCGDDSQCETGLCLAEVCVDPDGDNDGDGLVNGVEVSLGTALDDADSDGDGARDDVEVADVMGPDDQDGDGRIDALEADDQDVDQDCLVDERDARDGIQDAAPDARVAEVCPNVGVCQGASARRVVCPEDPATPVCALDDVPRHEPEETLCDGLDNDCDGASDPGCPEASDGLVGHWRLDGDGLDGGPFEDHGTVLGATAVADRFGRVGGALRFSGSGHRVAVPLTRHPLGPDVAVTVTAWIRPDGDTASRLGVLGFGGRAEAAEGLIVGRQTAQVGCLLAVDGGPTPGCAPAGHWSFVARVRDGKTERLYLDGRLVSESDAVSAFELKRSALTIGAVGIRADGSNFEAFSGAIDDVRLFQGALGEAALAKLFEEDGWQRAGSPSNPAQSCLHVRDAAGATVDGAAHLDTDGDGPEAAFVAWCDQTTAGGGWTLAWVYDFTAPAAFTSAANAVTPSPGWPLGGVDVEEAAGPPEGPGSVGAIPWARWEAVGTAFRHVHPLTGDLACVPEGDGGGSFATGRAGAVSCEPVAAGGGGPGRRRAPHPVRPGASGCEGVLPAWVFFWEDGPGLAVSGDGGDGLFAYFDGSRTGSWPTHDPCGAGAPPVEVPVAPGALYLR